jgi:hypothetical protein
MPVRQMVWCAMIALLGMPAATHAQLTNPIPQPIVKGSLRVRIENLVQMPSTTGTLGTKADHTPSARARINFLRESPDGRVWVNDLRGQLYVLDDHFQPQLFVDLDAANGGVGSIFPAMHFANGLAAGFISFNFHPEFVQPGASGYGKLFTIHMERAQDTSAVPHFATVDLRTGNHPVTWHTVVTEWSMANPLANVWNPATDTRREVLRVGTTAESYFHPYGDLQFNPLAGPGDDDYGLAYISGGYWGYINGAGAPQGSPTEGQPAQLQRLDTLAGTMIRIDPRSSVQTGGQAGFGDYTIPPNNPFVDGDPNTFDEIYAFGFRNGHRMAWDPFDGTLYVMNIGHANLEEIERVVPGGNYGWGVREGTFVNGNDLASGGNGDADDVFAHNVADAADVDFRGEEFLYPVAQYDHGEGQSIAGGFVYHGTQLPQLAGKFIFGDIVRGRIFAADVDDMRNVDITDPSPTAFVEEIQLFTVNSSGVETNVNLSTLVGGNRTDLRFAQRPDGEIYILTKTDGFVRRLAGPRGDYNRNGVVDIDDYTVWRDSLGQAGTLLAADGNADGSIDPGDYDFWKNSFGDSGGAGAVTAVPEPRSITLSLIALATLLSRSARRMSQADQREAGVLLETIARRVHYQRSHQ